MVETEMNKKARLIFIPSPGIRQLSLALEFAKLLINHCDYLSITVLSIKLSSTPFSDSYIESVFSSQPQIELIDVPEVQLPPQELLLKSPLYYVWTFMQSLVPHAKDTVQSILSSYPNSNLKPLVVWIVDFVCASMIDVGKELSIPSYLYMPTNVGFLSLMISLQNCRIKDVFKDSDPDLLIPGISKLVPPTVLTDAVLNKDGGYVACYKLAKSFKVSKGIIINTFSKMEQYAIDALSKSQTPPIYAEQQLNAFWMVKESGLALELKLDYRTDSDIVMTNEIEKGQKQLMDKDSVVHKKVKEMKYVAGKAVLNGGSSFDFIEELIEDIVSLS